MTDSTSIGLLGAGAVAQALCARLCAAGCEVAVWARRAAAARALTGDLPARVLPALEDLAGVDLALVCVADRGIAPLAQALATAVGRPRPGAVALHTSGYHDATPLAPLARAGWSVGGLHPLVSFTPGGALPPRLEGAWYTLCGESSARTAARGLVTHLGGRELHLAEGPGVRAAYHGAATLAAGGLVALVDLALEALGEAAPRDQGGQALAHLLGGVLEGVAALGPRDALSGPVARGDREVVAGHLEVLPEEPRAAYRVLARRMLALARERGTARGQGVSALERLLKEPRA